MRAAVTDRLVELDQLGLGADLDGVLLGRPIDVGVAGGERGVASERRGPSDPLRAPDRATAFLDDAA